MTHYCPACGEFSYHPSNARPWALRCGACGATSPQHPHPPEPATGDEAPAQPPPEDSGSDAGPEGTP